MSQENVELVRKAIEARNRDLDEWLTFFDPEVEGSDTMIVAGMQTETRGTDELREAVEKWDEGFEDFRTEVVELIDAGEDRVVAMTRVTGRGKGSGIPVDEQFGQVWTLRDGRVVRIETYVNPSEALEAARLSE